MQSKPFSTPTGESVHASIHPVHYDDIRKNIVILPLALIRVFLTYVRFARPRRHDWNRHAILDRKVMSSPQKAWEDVQVGEQLPRIEMEVTATMIAQSAIAAFDLFPGHHVSAYAKDQGQDDIFLCTSAFQGFIDRLLSEWAGPRSSLKKFSFRMVRSVYPGDRMYGDATVRECHAGNSGERLVDLDIEVGTPHGACVHAQATMKLFG